MTKLLIVSRQNELSVAENIEGVLPEKIESAKRIEIFFDSDELKAFNSLICKVFNDLEDGIHVFLRSVDCCAFHSSFNLTIEQLKLMLRFIYLIKNTRLDLIGCYGKIADAAWLFVDRGIFAGLYTEEYERFYLPESATPTDAIEFMKNTVAEIAKTPYLVDPDYCKLERIYFNKLIPNPTEKDIRDDAKCPVLTSHREDRQAYVIKYDKMFYLFSENLNTEANRP